MFGGYPGRWALISSGFNPLQDIRGLAQLMPSCWLGPAQRPRCPRLAPSLRLPSVLSLQCLSPSLPCVSHCILHLAFPLPLPASLLVLSSKASNPQLVHAVFRLSKRSSVFRPVHFCAIFGPVFLRTWTDITLVRSRVRGFDGRRLRFAAVYYYFFCYHRNLKQIRKTKTTRKSGEASIPRFAGVHRIRAIFHRNWDTFTDLLAPFGARYVCATILMTKSP